MTQVTFYEFMTKRLYCKEFEVQDGLIHDGSVELLDDLTRDIKRDSSLPLKNNAFFEYYNHIAKSSEACKECMKVLEFAWALYASKHFATVITTYDLFHIMLEEDA